MLARARDLAITIFNEYFKEGAQYKIQLNKTAKNDILMKFGCVDHTETILQCIDRSLNHDESGYVSPIATEQNDEDDSPDFSSSQI